MRNSYMAQPYRTTRLSCIPFELRGNHALIAAMLAVITHQSAPRIEARITIEGDIETLRQVSAAHQSNRQRLQTWRGIAHVDHREQDASQPPGDSRTAAMKIGTVSFVQTQFKLRSHWTDEVVKYPTQEANPAAGDKLRFYNQMRLNDGLYRYRGTSGSAGSAQLVIFPSSDPPSYEDLDAMGLLQKDFQGQDYETLLNHICTEVSRAAAGSNDDSQDTRITITRTGDVVELQLAADRTGMSSLRDTLRFDLARGGNLVGREHGGTTATVRIAFVYEDRDGVWIPTNYEENRIRQSGNLPAVTALKTIAFVTEEVNQPIPDSEFTLTSLGVKPGDIVTDRRQGESSLSFRYTGRRNGLPEAELDRFVAALTTGNPASQPVADTASAATVPRRKASEARRVTASVTSSSNLPAGHAFPFVRLAAVLLCMLAVASGALWLARRTPNPRETHA